MNKPDKRAAKRRAAEKRFRFYGAFSVVLSLSLLGFLFFVIFSKGYLAFTQTYVLLDINLENAGLMEIHDYNKTIRDALKKMFPEVKSRNEKKELYKLLGNNAAYELRDKVKNNPDQKSGSFSVWFTSGSLLDQLWKHPDYRERLARVNNNKQPEWLAKLAAEGRVEKRFSSNFLALGDSRYPEQAGIFGALKGSLMTIIVTIVLSFPIGIAAAVYLEEFAHKNRVTDLIEITINNLAAVPSIIFGLLGLSVLINFFDIPRSSSLVGGITLSLMTLPTIIIASRASLQSVPKTIYTAARALGASQVQVVFHHAIPLAMPGMLTGSIIGVAQAIGETAPLLLIGMVAFIADAPSGFTSPATTLPVQIFLWFDSPERGFSERAAGATIVLLLLLITINSIAVVLRKKFEKRW